MIRVLGELGTIVIAGVTMAKFTLDYIKKKRHSANIEHVRRLEEENREMDKINRRISG